MYRLLVLALVVTVTAAFSGCGAKTETPSAAPGAPEVSAPAAPAETAPAAPAETAPAAAETAAPAGDEASADEADWGEFEVVPSASASAQKKE